jgi:hypothetical protein
MREIKFRAWNTIGKKMHPDSDWAYGWYMIKEQYESGLIVLLQYTDLKDANGVEIYEGDIVKTDYDNGYEVLTHVVKWCGPSYPAFELSPTLPCESNGFSYIHECGDTTIEVIGNIYENAELLK